ncbi:hypothetical protein WMY93_027111 [Mugilogobius chulae]|uniref:Integrase zinc-binding domain-containing protein n=1 Tax=Mugilogobius chulae TaxID=88201 RepID=A0AAW0MS10_9GOBI
MSMERTLDLAPSHFYWSRMSVDVVNKIRTCERCVRRKSLPEHKAPLVNIQTSRPLELVCIHFLSVEPCGRIKDILVMTDHFTKLPVDLAFGLPLNEDKPDSHLQYVQKLKSHLKDGYKLASENSHCDEKSRQSPCVHFEDLPVKRKSPAPLPPTPVNSLELLEDPVSPGASATPEPPESVVSEPLGAEP